MQTYGDNTNLYFSQAMYIEPFSYTNIAGKYEPSMYKEKIISLMPSRYSYQELKPNPAIL